MPDYADQERIEFTRYMVQQEIDTAEAFVAKVLSKERLDEIPSALLVVGEKKGYKSTKTFPLPPMTNIPSYSAVLMKEGIADIGRKMGKRHNWHPLYVVSMVEIVGLTLESWISEIQESAASDVTEVDRSMAHTLVITAADVDGYQMRRICAIESDSTGRAGYRELGQSREVESIGEVSEMDAFWQAFKAARVESSGQGFGQIRTKNRMLRLWH